MITTPTIHQTIEHNVTWTYDPCFARYQGPDLVVKIWDYAAPEKFVATVECRETGGALLTKFFKSYAGACAWAISTCANKQTY